MIYQRFSASYDELTPWPRACPFLLSVVVATTAVSTWSVMYDSCRDDEQDRARLLRPGHGQTAIYRRTPAATDLLWLLAKLHSIYLALAKTKLNSARTRWHAKHWMTHTKCKFSYFALSIVSLGEVILKLVVLTRRYDPQTTTLRIQHTYIVERS